MKIRPLVVCPNGKFRYQWRTLVGASLLANAGAAVPLKHRGDAFASRLAPSGFCFGRALCRLML
ncbi:hypothetical protein FJD35_09720 [Pseudomonas mandelii]|nr:hypothetical protein FJD35_09720 [Pseudomonas mandelii]